MTAVSGQRARIFVDIDGVLADFDTHAREQGKIDAEGKLKWDELDHQWWKTIPVFHGAREFFDANKKLAPTGFLTAPTMSKDSFSGKVEWVMNFLPERGKFVLQDLIIAPAKDKRFLAGPGRILVDDSEKNIAAWEAEGGTGILHKGNFAETLARVAEAVAVIESQPVLQNLKAAFDAPAKKGGKKETTSDRIKEFLTLQEGSVKDWKRRSKKMDAERQWVRVFENRKTGGVIESTEFADKKFFFRILERARAPAPAPANGPKF